MKAAPVLILDNASTAFCPTIELLTVADVAELLKISVSGVRRLQQARHLPFVKIGGSVRFSKNDILSYLEKQRVDSVD
jgi:excisionase family DNA binding protein